MSDYGKRTDGTNKGAGYFGELKRPDGSVSTEISVGVGFDDGEAFAPMPEETEQDEFSRAWKENE